MNCVVCRTIVAITAMILLFISHGTYASDEIKSIQQMWNDEQYREVALKLIEYRKGPYGENAVVDYMLATSLCRIPDFKERAAKYFQWILAYYSLDSTSRRKVIKEMQECAQKSDTKPETIVFMTKRVGSGSAGVKGKMYHWLDSDYAPLTSDPVEVVKDIPIETLQKRLFDASQKDEALDSIKKIVTNKFKITTTPHFIIASSSKHTMEDLNEIGKGLEAYLDFYVQKYQVTAPAYFITVYLVPETWELQKLAEKIHGIKVSDSSIGYSYQDDLSIVGVIPKMTYGTLSHELFHLVVHNNFGDIPPWMDEGMASLYEVSKIAKNGIVGLPNWRGKILERYWQQRPTVRNLVRMDWNSFNNSEGDYEAKQQAVNHAMARYFILYLQNKQKLVDVYKAFRDRKVEDMKDDPGTDAVLLLESVLAQSLPETDKDFVQWFKSKTP